MLGGFIVENWKHKVLPSEDVIGFGVRRACDGKDIEIIVAADGITRDPLIRNDWNLPDSGNFFGKMMFSMFYPRPSHAAKAAKIVCDAAINFDYNHLNQIDENTARWVLRTSNSHIKKYQKKEVPKGDYLQNDFPGAVAALALFSGEQAYWSFITDCGFAVFGKEGEVKFKTPNENPNSKGSIDEDVAKKYNTSFRESKGRKIIRSEYRNNPKNPLAYGALTGEEFAIPYIRSGKRLLSPGDICAVYSDGVEEILFPGKKPGESYEAVAKRWAEIKEQKRMISDFFCRQDFFGLKQYCRANVRTEGSLVLRVGD